MGLQQNHTAEQWITSFQNGEEAGFNYFFRLYHKPLCFFANKYLKDMAVAEDVVSESFIAIWEKRKTIRDENHLKNWLYKAVYFGCLHENQKSKVKRKNAEKLILSAARDEKSYEENIVRAEMMRMLKDAVEQLPNECRKVFYKIYIDGKTVEETATELQVTASTVYNQRLRGIKLLKMRLKGFWFLLF